MLFAAELFAQNGFDTAVYGFGNAALRCPKIKKESTAGAALSGADYAVLPPVVSRDGKNIFAPLAEEEAPASALDFGNSLVFCGTSCPHMAAKTVCYALRESFAVSNALPTAESAIKIAMEERKSTVCGMRAAVLGFGRIGKLLAKDLLALGARVDVYARRSEARAWAEVIGAQAMGFDALAAQIASYDCIFNTVPENVVSADALARIGRGVPLLELASPPGGVDAAEAEKAGVHLVAAGGLPGKIMPKAAGKIIYETVREMIEEEENR